MSAEQNGGLKARLVRLWKRERQFYLEDIWSLTQEEVDSRRRPFISTFKVLWSTVEAFISDDLISKASSLTYSTILSIVPMLAVIVGIAKGFGLQEFVHANLVSMFPGQEAQLDEVFVYVENYLAQVQGGLFIGLGLLILLYTVLMLLVSVEDTLNSIWQAPHARPWSRRVIDYLGLFLLMPIVLIVNSGLTLLFTTLRQSLQDNLTVLAPIMESSLTFAPLVLSVLSCVCLYMFLPNVRVQFVPALIAGVVAGIAYQIFQGLYISGVLWISRYNAIYGSFAAVPLLLLWLQVSWTIILLGAQLSYCIQNLPSLAFGKASLKASRRYLDFVSILIVSKIAQRFATPESVPYRAETVSSECRIPLRMATSVLSHLETIGILSEIEYGADNEKGYYQPAIDPALLSVGYLIERLDNYGEEDFRIDLRLYHNHWEAMLTAHGQSDSISVKTLLRDLG